MTPARIYLRPGRGGQYGLHLLWIMLLLLPITYFVQEMVARLGIATGKGVRGDDLRAPEHKCATNGLGPIAITPGVRISLITPRGYLIAMSLMLLWHIFELAGWIHGS